MKYGPKCSPKDNKQIRTNVSNKNNLIPPPKIVKDEVIPVAHLKSHSSKFA
jgi:hypothetical protein